MVFQNAAGEQANINRSEEKCALAGNNVWRESLPGQLNRYKQTGQECSGKYGVTKCQLTKGKSIDKDQNETHEIPVG